MSDLDAPAIARRQTAMEAADGATKTRLSRGENDRRVRAAAASSLASNIEALGEGLAPRYATLKTIFDAETGNIQQSLLSVLDGIDKTSTEMVVRAQLNAASPMMQAAAIKLLPRYEDAADQGTLATTLSSTYPAIVDAAIAAVANWNLPSSARR